MLELNFDPFPVLETERLILRAMIEEDLDYIYVLRSHEAIMQFIAHTRVHSLEEARKWMDKIQKNINENKCVLWAISLKGHPGIIGTFVLWNIQNAHYRAEVGYVLHPDHWKKGYMQEAMSVVLDYAFNVLKFHSLEAHVNPDNNNSVGTLERNGFVREALFKENFRVNGEFKDTAIYSLLKSNYKP